jgi:hypothetical protein
LAQAYLNRCLVNYDGLKSVNVCNGGGCEGWSITARSVFLINKATRVYLNNTAACSTTELIRHGELNFVGYCVSPLGKLSYFRPGTANAGPIMAITKPANLPAQAQNTRISVRGISQGILYGQESNPYMYSLTLQDAVCTWYKYCDPNTQSLKAGVTPVGEINQSGSTTTFDANHPVRSLCRLKPNWYMGNAALNCAITQKGGLAKLCATPNPLDTTPQLGTP